ncbi:predicted xylanase/chitin deacetylase [Bellilinea caldifistulae]|uniref:polysaccharide deacetylase family protein n=1 Tax=Bellilinea caldifistulae TaxID=360411 RepID=UPI0014703E2C|nr:polysaccharide deacetylase family protein [Bellilinea caldifistulae]GAP10186.1 predicted xylanase/chitin deacetylase [Bellilinea caldifistulae]
MNFAIRLLALIAGLAGLLVAGCVGRIQAAAQQPASEAVVSAQSTQLPSRTPTLFKTPTPIVPSLSPSPTLTQTPSGTPAPSLTPTPALVYYPAGQINVPILLYHRIVDGEAVNRYEVSLENFHLQMDFLRRNGYETITPVQLAKVILKGGELPAKPVILTFDDGYRSIYDLAFPVLNHYGFEGVVYVITGCVGAPTYMNSEQITELFANGWEIGSHTVSHEDLVKNPSHVYDQIVVSKLYLEKLLGTKELTLAYPYGKADENITRKAARYGYYAGMGLGVSNIHSVETLYFLSRQEIKSDCDLGCFEEIVTGKKIQP